MGLGAGVITGKEKPPTSLFNRIPWIRKEEATLEKKTEKNQERREKQMERD